MEGNREFADEMYAALNSRDLDTFLSGVSEDVECRSLIAEAEGELFRGHEGVRQWWEQVVHAIGGLDFEIQKFTEDGDAGVVKLRVRGSVDATGIEQTMWQAIVIRDRKALWWETFRTEDEAWAAARARAQAPLGDESQG